MALTTAERLVEAEEALHALLTGQKMVTLSYEGRSFSYSQANIDALRQYIRDLKSEIAITAGTQTRRPFGVSW